MTLNSKFRNMFVLKGKDIDNKFNEGVKEVKARESSLLNEYMRSKNFSPAGLKKIKKDFGKALKKLNEKRAAEKMKLRDSVFLRQQKEKHNKIYKDTFFR